MVRYASPRSGSQFLTAFWGAISWNDPILLPAGRRNVGASLDRRNVLLFCAMAPAIWADMALARSGRTYPITIKVLREGATIEMGAHIRYADFSQRADEEGYKGIAYMLTALATSELIHAQNYGRTLALLGASIDHPQPQVPTVSDTKSNLIFAAEAEINTVDNVYPEILVRLRDENHEEAVQSVIYAWESHKQHRDIIKKIQKWSPDFFETVARRIDDKSDHYYVCKICGSTLYEIPADTCPICKHPSTHYSLIDSKTFL